MENELRGRITGKRKQVETEQCSICKIIEVSMYIFNCDRCESYVCECCMHDGLCDHCYNEVN